MIKAKVLVLMSTYNGEKYIEEQLKSILDQEIEEVNILIRDDGSTDGTVIAINKWVERFPQKIKFNKEVNKGVVSSFFELVKWAPLDYDYYFFSDQDDWWEKIKIKKAIEKIKSIKKEKKIGYCSNLNLVDKNLKFLGKKYTKELIPSLKNCFVENIVTGCTFCANNLLFREIKKDVEIIEKNIEKILMHDYHFYFLAMLYGKLIYDKGSYISYRQHENNVIGMEKNKFKFMIKRVKKILQNKNRRIIYLKFLNENYKEKLSIAERKKLDLLIESYTTITGRVKFILKNKFDRQNKLDSFLMKLLYLFKRF